jgi:3-oxoacyl-(acyl-carrier-protein) synthase/acyl carrier protein/SAM-dependent methyltransferase
MYSNTPQEGRAAFARCLASPYPQLLFGRLGPNLLAEVGVTGVQVHGAGGHDAEDAPAVAAAVRRAHAAAEADVAQSLSGVDRLQQCCHLLLLKTFRDAGVLVSAHGSWRIDDVRRKLRVSAAYERLFAALVDMLERAGFATIDNGILRATPRIESPSVAAALARIDDFVRETADRYPEFAAHLEFVQVALRAYPDVLSGKRLATDVLFPRSSTRLVEAVYAGSRAAAHYHQLVASGVAAAVRARQNSGDRTGPIEILEVGAGTGSTTAFVLEAVRPHADSLRYWYTDVSPTLLNYGSGRFGERYPFVRFAKLDVEQVGNGPISAGSVDIVVASNVLHASADLKRTIAQLTSLIRPGGVLILNELMRTPDWATLTFGCLQGWWLSSDTPVRLPHSPLVNESTWASLLRDAGYDTVDAVGGLDDRADYRQAVIVASYGAAANAPAADVAGVLRGLIAAELQIDPARIEGATPFGEYGLDSIGMAALVKRLERALDISLNPAALLEHPTLDQLSEYMRGEYASAFAAGVGATPAPRPLDTPAADDSHRAAAPEARPAPQTAAAADDTTVSLAVLTRIFAAQLALPAGRLDPDMPFGEFGIDSIVMGALVKRIESELSLSLNPAALLEHPTLRALAGYLTHEYGDAFGDTPAAAAAPEPLAPRVAAGNGEEPIAVVGYSCRFPGAENAGDFWTNLRNGVDSVGEVPSDRWNIADLYRPTPQPGKSVSKWGGFVDDVDRFDAGYFEIKEADAPHIDPLARLFLEQGALAVHHAGYERKTLWGRDVGVFVGARVSNYGARIAEPTKTTLPGVSQNFVAAQVSHFFNFMGPSLVVDTACSSSLVSLHLACQSLRTGECEVAIAGGVEILLDESVYLLVSEARAFSPDGKCHTFDERANGFVPGEGCGAVLLKPLSAALRDRDRIYGVIRTSVVNNDGHTMGITTPNIQAQKALVQKALSQARIDPGTITCIEAHGTGTLIGDPIELKALTEAFKNGTDDVGFCAVGCVKTNIGHLASAAGIAGLIKMLLALEHRALPPTLHCERPNPRFDFAKSPFYPNTTLKEWAPRHGVRRAGISAFGLGGTNAHVIVEEFDRSAFAHYAPAERNPPPVVFNRKRFWIDRPSAAPDNDLRGCLMLEEAELVGG